MTAGALYSPRAIPNNEDRVLTFQSFLGTQTLRVQFSTFATEANFDWLEAYEAPIYVPVAPQRGRWSGPISPPTLVSLESHLTFRFTSDGTNTAQGWVANVSCSGDAPPPAYALSGSGGQASVCSAIFYDDGGATAAYTAPQDRIFTFCAPAPDKYLVMQFPYQFQLAAGDTMWVYESTAPHPDSLIGIYVGQNVGEQIAGTRPGGCLTFRFKATGTFPPTSGWQGVLSCEPTPQPLITWMRAGLRRTCNLRLYDSGGPTGTYGSNENTPLRIVSPTGCGGVRIQFNSFTTEACCDSLVLYDGGTTSAPRIGRYSGSSVPNGGNPLSTTGDTLLILFRSDGSQNLTGWVADISCPGAPTATLSPAGSVTRCARDSVVFTVSPSGTGYVYQWNTGHVTTSPTYTVQQAGTYYVTVVSPTGCQAVSAPTVVSFHPPIDTSVSVSGSGPGSTTLTGQGCGSGFLCQWISCANPSQVLHTGSSFVPTQTGTYALVIRNLSTNCQDTSACYWIDLTSGVDWQTREISLYPNPTSTGWATLVGTRPIREVRVWNAAGQELQRISVSSLPIRVEAREAGLYFVQVIGAEGEQFLILWQVLR